MGCGAPRQFIYTNGLSLWPNHMQVLEGIARDSAELVRTGLLQDMSDPLERVKAAGPTGAPFSYANAVHISTLVLLVPIQRLALI